MRVLLPFILYIAYKNQIKLVYLRIDTTSLMQFDI